MRHLMISLLVMVLITSCRSTTPSASNHLSSAVNATNDLNGYDFSGPKTMEAAPKDMICTALVRAEEVACQDVKGKTILANKCQVMCSIPIAPKGKVAGYNFKSFIITDALPAGKVCAAVVSPEHEACLKAGGKVTIAEKCSALCSVRISR